MTHGKLSNSLESKFYLLFFQAAHAKLSHEGVNLIEDIFSA